jgi:ornithine cyclodeaminase
MPDRQHYDVSGSGSLLLMPAWTDGQALGVKVVQVFPENTRLNKPTVHSTYMLASAVTGETRAIIDGGELTVRRTAATSALASQFLSRESSRCLLLMGIGALALDVISAHASVRPINRVLLWARRPEAAKALGRRVRGSLGLHAEVVRSLPAALEIADIVSTITTARDPILPGRYVRPGTHIDLIGGFTPQMREADDDVVRSGTLFVDMLTAALREAGDVVDPIARGVISTSAVRGDLFDLCSNRVSGRDSEHQITVFKSVGLALEDLAAATLAWNACSMGPADRRS